MVEANPCPQLVKKKKKTESRSELWACFGYLADGEGNPKEHSLTRGLQFYTVHQMLLST